MSKTPRDDRTASLFRMLEDKIALERAFGVEVVSAAKPDAAPAAATEENARPRPVGAVAPVNPPQNVYAPERLCTGPPLRRAAGGA